MSATAAAGDSTRQERCWKEGKKWAPDATGNWSCQDQTREEKCWNKGGDWAPDATGKWGCQEGKMASATAGDPCDKGLFEKQMWDMKEMGLP
jgi:hypothetical protein